MAKSVVVSLTNNDAAIALGMVARGDKDHDIAAWFGVNQGRIAEVKGGSHGQVQAADPSNLPPKGPPGIKGRRLRRSVDRSIELLIEKGPEAALEVTNILQEAQKRYDANEA